MISPEEKAAKIARYFHAIGFYREEWDFTIDLHAEMGTPVWADEAIALKELMKDKVKGTWDCLDDLRKKKPWKYRVCGITPCQCCGKPLSHE